MKLSIALISFLMSMSASASTLKEVRQSLSAQKGTWQAGDVRPDVGVQVKGKTFFGLRTDLTPPPNIKFKKATPYKGKIPAKLDWRDKDGKNWVSSVKNQGKCGSCVAFGTLSAVEGRVSVSSGIPDYNIDLSEQDPFSRLGKCEQGSSPFTALMEMMNGVVDETCSPYISGRKGEDFPNEQKCKNYSERVVAAVPELPGQTGTKELLQTGPVLTTMTVYDDFMYYTSGVYKHVTGDALGGHAIAIVGYDDEGKYWIVKNSWGEDWGENGFFRISYDDDSGVGATAFAFDPIVPDQPLKLVKPAYREAVKGTITIQAQALKAVTKPVMQMTCGTQNVAGTLNPATLSAEFNTATMPDGLCELSVNGGGKPWYSLLTIANQPQNVTVELTPKFDNTQPVKDRVYFGVILHGTVTSVALTLTKVGESSGKTVVVDDPGADVEIGWRTAMYPNGEYEIVATGRIGALAEFRSNPLKVVVKN